MRKLRNAEKRCKINKKICVGINTENHGNIYSKTVVITSGTSLRGKIWIGKEVSIPIMMTIAVGIYMIINSWDSLQVNMINGIGAVKLQTYITSLGLIIHIPLSLFLGKYIGAVGVVCSMILINILYTTVFTKQINKLLNNKAKGAWLK